MRAHPQGTGKDGAVLIRVVAGEQPSFCMAMVGVVSSLVLSINISATGVIAIV